MRRKSLAVLALSGATATGLLSMSSALIEGLELSTSQAAERKSLVLGKDMTITVDGYANAIAWSPDSRHLAVLDQIAHQLVVWDTTTRRVVFKVPDLAGASRGLAYTPDGNFITSNDGNSTALPFAVWNAHSGELVHDVQRPNPASPGQTLIYGANILLADPLDSTVISIPLNGSRVEAYDIRSWSVRYSVPYLTAVISTAPGIMSAAVSVDGRLAIADLSGRVQLWRLADNGSKKVADFLAEENPAGVPGPRRYGPITAAYRSGFVSAVAFSPNGDFLAVGSTVDAGQAREQLRLWDVRTLAAVRSYDTGAQRQKISNLSFSPDGRFIATAGDPMPVRVWDAGPPVLLRAFPNGGKVFDVVAFSPNGQKLAYGGESVIHIVDVE